MSKIIDIGVEKDHIEAQTKANGITALAELIWNSLDADATEIIVDYRATPLGGYEYIKVKDNGHGLTYVKAQDVFSRLGGSEKKVRTQSPGGRPYHGKEGKGRYKSLALGDFVEFLSMYEEDGRISQFTATIDRNQLSKTEFSDLKTLQKGKGSKGLQITITNVNVKNVEQAVKITNRKEIEERFASYWITYPNFRILFNGDELEFRSIIKHTDEETIKIEKEGVGQSFKIKLIEWNFENKRKTYLCNNDGIPFLEVNIGLRSSSIPISVFIQSDYIEKLQRENTIDFWENDEVVMQAYKESKNFARDYIRKRLHQYSKAFIDELKEKGIYPYKGNADNVVEETKRQVFDIVALQINEYLPSFNEQDDRAKKLTLMLVGEALENDSVHLGKILTEVIGLPQDKREELSELLGTTTLSNIIDTMAEIKNRLNFLNGLEQIIYNKDLHKDFKERKHLHKIIVNETWIFGEQYTLGVDDVTLKNVLKGYIKSMGREDFVEVIESQDNTDLKTIPDVCLWQQYSMGSAGKENLVIELKKPSLDAGFDEKTQIESYASKVSNDRRFPKEKTRWKFILVTKDIKTELSPHLRQANRSYGHISQLDNCDVFILTWGDIISEAKLRHEFIKEKLNINLQANEEGLAYIKEKYREYLPQGFAGVEPVA